MPNLDREQNPHPKRSELEQLLAESIHRQAYELATLVASIEQTFSQPPGGYVVGSFVLDPDHAGDIDMEVHGVSWENLQEFFRDRAGSANIQDVTLTVTDDDGLIDPTNNPQAFGNAFVCVWLSMEGGRHINLSVPMEVDHQTNRYDRNTAAYDPEMGLERASRRRSFAHKALLYDPLAGECGSIEDPQGGRRCLHQQQLHIINPESYKTDPLGLYLAIREAVELNLTPDASSRELLKQMAHDPIPEDPAVAQPDRLAYERSRFFTSHKPPSQMLQACYELGVLRRDAVVLHGIGRMASVAWLRMLENVDSAWSSAQSETWGEEETVAHVLARLTYESGRADPRLRTPEFKDDCAEPFLGGGERGKKIRELYTRALETLDSGTAGGGLSSLSSPWS